MRPLLFFVLLTSLPTLAQDCIEIAPIDTLYAGEFPQEYSLRVTVTHSSSTSSAGWVIGSGADVINGLQGNYGDTITIGPFTCAEEIPLAGFFDRADNTCVGLYDISFAQLCGDGICTVFQLQETDEIDICPTEGPVLVLQSGAAPLVATISRTGMTNTITRPIDFIDRVLDLSDLPLDGVYTVTVTSGDGCTTNYQFVIGNCTHTFSGFSWLDANANGIREDGEPGQGALVHADGPRDFAVTTTVNPDGTYLLEGLIEGNYQLRFTPDMENLIPTRQNQGNDPERDSDATWQTSIFIEVPGDDTIPGSADIGWIGTNCSLTSSILPDECEMGNGSITLTASGPGPINYQLYRNNTLVAETNGPGFNNLEGGNYEVRAIDATGCTTIENLNVPLYYPSARIYNSGPPCFSPGDVVPLSVLPLDSTNVSTYQWSTGETTPSINITDFYQTYFVTVTFTNGCTLNLSHIIEFGQALELPDVELGCTSGTAELTLPSAYTGLEVFWTRPSGQSTSANRLNIDEAGVYQFFAEDLNGDLLCSVGGEVKVNDSRLNGFSLDFFDGLDCDGTSNLRIRKEYPYFEAYELYNFDFDGPNLIERSDNPFLRDRASVTGRESGVFTATVSSYCGDTTLTVEGVFEDLDCENRGNIGGYVHINEGLECMNPINNGIGIPDITIWVHKRDTPEEYFFVTDEAGRWFGTVPEGSWRIGALTPADGSLKLCNFSIRSTELGRYSASNAMLPLRDCPSLNVGITTPRLRRCFSNEAIISLNNNGRHLAEEVQLRVTVDPFFNNITASMPFIREEDELIFDLATLAAASNHKIRLYFEVSCEAELGQLHCLEASVSAINQCEVGEDIALLNVASQSCMTDSVTFSITNLGTRDMVFPLNYYVIRDGRNSQEESGSRPPLAAGETSLIQLEANGSTVELVVDQVPGSPGTSSPSATVIGCGGDINGGAPATQESDNGIQGLFRHCRNNRGSFDPNEKLVYPLGTGQEGDVQPGTRLTYDLHFQNTGTDTAFTVVIRDTLPVELDIKSIKFGPSSHDYKVTIDEFRVLTYTFKEIDLVDSFTNVMGSMGVVSFSIDHNENLLRGDSFENRAGIYFDFNEPVITEYARTRIAPLPFPSSTRRLLRNGGLPINLAPVPASNTLIVGLPEDYVRHGSWITIVGPQGRRLLEVAQEDFTGTVDVSTYPTGLYSLLVSRNGQVQGTKRFVVIH